MTYNTSPVTYEYDIYDWLWRAAFFVAGVFVGFVIWHIF